jgi:hypothetical protein
MEHRERGGWKNNFHKLMLIEKGELHSILWEYVKVNLKKKRNIGFFSCNFFCKNANKIKHKKKDIAYSMAKSPI